MEIISRALSGALILAPLLIAGCNQKSTSPASALPVAAPTDKHILYFDDILNNADGRAFESAFALDSSCHGLKFIRWDRGDDPALQAVLDGPRWDVAYVSGSYRALTMQARNFEGLQVGVEVKNVEDAVHKACAVANGKGGTR
jgi:hypothetical protein